MVNIHRNAMSVSTGSHTQSYRLMLAFIVALIVVLVVMALLLSIVRLSEVQQVISPSGATPLY